MAKKKFNTVKFTGKVETVEQYLARGKQITKVPETTRTPQPDVIRKTVTGAPAIIMTLEEADLFYGEARKNQKPKKVKPSLKIDLDALPPALKAKFMAKLKEGSDGEGYEEELEEASSTEDEEDGDED